MRFGNFIFPPAGHVILQLGAREGYGVWISWDLFEGHETLFLFPLPLLETLSVLLTTQTCYIKI